MPPHTVVQLGRRGSKLDEYPTIELLRGGASSLAQTLSWKEMQQIAYKDHAEEVQSKKEVSPRPRAARRPSTS
jgi:hypothetical protein